MQCAGQGKLQCLKRLDPLCKAAVRYLYSQTRTWPKQYDQNTRLQLETHWKERLKKQDRLSSQMDLEKEKYYVLSMFPYPSGQLHMGHVRVYTISDAMARYHRLAGKQVIHPMGWDAFGLPAENAAIERRELPDKWTYSNIITMKKQLEDLCFSFDWEREYATCDPDYYKWTQYLFIKLYEAGLVYQKEAPVNWDPVDLTVLANEQIDDKGRSWRSGAVVEKRMLRQWYIKTTAYSKSLYDGLDEVDKELWQDVVDLQKQWIGHCVGARIEFTVQNNGSSMEDRLSIFTPSPEGAFGISHILLSPDHPLNKSELYKSAGNLIESDHVRELLVTAVNPYNQSNIPIFIQSEWDLGDDSDSFAAIPSLSLEDKLFAEARELHYHDVIEGNNLKESGKFTGLTRQEGFNALTKHAKEIGHGGDITSQKLSDWLISRQRYWGTPIPMVHCKKHGTMPVSLSDLPVTLPKLTEFLGKGPSPLATAKDWTKVKCSKCDCDGYATRETDTMDTFVDSSWYFLRYLDPRNAKEPFSEEKASKYMPVDLYIGGKEHATLHLYFARFFSHFLYDCGLIPCREPFVNLLTQGMVMGRSYRLKGTGKYLPPDQVEFKENKAFCAETGAPLVVDWEKMSKSKYNGVDPQDVIEEYGPDATRLCILSGVAPKSDRNWNPEAFVGIQKWQSRVWTMMWGLHQERCYGNHPSELSNQYRQFEEVIYDSRNYFLKEVSFHMEKTFMLSVAISRLQGLTNALKSMPPEVVRCSCLYEQAFAELIIMMAPFAPMFASELWTGLAAVPHKTTTFDWDASVLTQKWPTVDPKYKLPMKIKINGKSAYEVRLPMTISETTADNLTTNLAVQLAQNHKDYAVLLGEKVITGQTLHLVPNVRADLNFVVQKDKKTKKKKLQQKEASGLS